MSEHESMKAYLAENPRMVGILFAVLVFLAQAGNAAAGYSLSTAGP